MQFDPNKITNFARTDARGQNVLFGIKAKDRQRHVYVIGKTGMGKSTLLENMAVQDIQNGEGLAFIDPHGAAAETLLNYIPEHRIKDVLYFAPFDMEHPVSFNIMEDVGVEKRHLVVSGLMSVFKKIWIDAWSARMEYILQNTLMALLEYPDSTLLGVNRMLSDKEYRKKVVDNLKDPGVRAFWVDEFAKYNERYMQEAGDAIKNKIGQFTANPIIRNIVGQPKSSFDIREMMDQKKILIVNLSKGLIGESNANLLGSMLTTRIYLAAMSRADLSPEKMREMPNFYFYVDEFQSFANATFANILSEARKYHLNLTIAHQYITQMEEEVRDAVFGNVGTIISFRVGPFDAEILETIFTPQFLATDIVNLGFAQIYLTLMIDGIGSQPFSATTIPPIQPQTTSYRDMVIASSRKQFAHHRAEVELVIQKFHEPMPAPERTPKDREKSFEKTTVPEVPVRREQQSVKPYVREGNVGSRIENKERTTEFRRTDVRPPTQSQAKPVPAAAPATQTQHEVVVPQKFVPPEKPREREPQKPQNADDLRSLLRNIVEKEKSTATKNVPPGNAKTEKFAESHKELREVVQVVMKEKPESLPKVDTSIPPTKKTEHEVTQVDTKEQKDVSSKQEVTPAELERMMRVSNRDASPY